jgi:uncharacterized SAM-binding protein YcdF (DUF218 family)
MSSPAACRIARDEQEMFRLADTVFVTSTGLLERAAATAKDVHLFPFATNFERFEAWRLSNATALLDDVADIPRPRIGYVGGIHRWIDQELLGHVADAHPEWSVVLVGPLQTETSRLARRRNIHLLGGKPHELLPSYLSAFDVTLIPYAITPYTQCVYPTKLNEYFAMGKPIVSTPLREVLAFNERHGPCVATGADASSFAEAIARALREDGSQAQRRIEIARQNSWSRRVAQMTRLIEERIEARERERLSNWQRLLAQVFGRSQIRWFRLGLAALASYLLVCGTPVVWWLAEPLKMTASPRSADAIVVFGGGVGESGQAGQGYEERIERAIRLYQAGYAPRLVISSGYSRVFREADVMLALATSLGVPWEAISLDETAVNTYENVLFVAATLRETGGSSILLVSSPYHMRRVAAVIRRQAPWLDMIPAPVERTAFYAHRWGATPRQIWGILHEYVAILVYWLRGWV